MNTTTVASSVVRVPRPDAASAVTSALEWLSDYARTHAFTVTRRGVDELEGWAVDEHGNLAHRSGRFFSVRAVKTVDQDVPGHASTRPILLQRDVGILGILRTTFHGVPHYLMQAKIEPGNPGRVQLSPTVQATRSNYTLAHRGAAVPYLEYFHPRPCGRVVVDSLQAEHSAIFYRKHNRNMIIEVSDRVEVLEGFRWLRLDEIAASLYRDEVVNMDSRSVLSILPAPPDTGGALHEDGEILSWLTRLRAADLYVSELVPLGGVARPQDGVIDSPDGDFRVLGVSVRGGRREVRTWDQPIVELLGNRSETLVTGRFRGQTHLLVRAVRHHGGHNSVELFPTLSLVDGQPDSSGLPLPADPTYSDGAEPPPGPDHFPAAVTRPHYDVRQSEEGGRFYHASSRYRLVSTSDELDPREPGPEYRWVTPRQLRDLAKLGYCVSVQARSLLCLLTTGAVAL